MIKSEFVEVHYEANGLRSLREIRNKTIQSAPHSHNEIEVMLLEKGQGRWLMGGDIVRIKAGRLVVFWAIRPHQIIESSPDTIINWLTIPLPIFTEWRPPQNLSKSLLAGNIVIEPDRDMFVFDKKAFARWHTDLVDPAGQRQKFALLEIEARLGRLAYSAIEKTTKQIPSTGMMNHSYFQTTAEIAEYVSKHYTEALSVEDIAKGVGMHPSSATKIFKKVCGVNLVQFLTQHRILHAQRLLVTTDMKILDIAFESGYRSVSRFYAAFKTVCSMSPNDFRSRLEAGKMPLQKKVGVWKIERKS